MYVAPRSFAVPPANGSRDTRSAAVHQETPACRRACLRKIPFISLFCEAMAAPYSSLILRPGGRADPPFPFQRRALRHRLRSNSSEPAHGPDSYIRRLGAYGYGRLSVHAQARSCIRRICIVCPNPRMASDRILGGKWLTRCDAAMQSLREGNITGKPARRVCQTRQDSP